MATRKHPAKFGIFEIITYLCAMDKPKEITKREYFAAMAMAGFSANPELNEIGFKDIAEMSINQADALISELTKTAREKYADPTTI